MAAALDFRFTDEELRRGIYYPRGHGEREVAQLAILHNLKRLLAGETAVNVNVREMPTTPEAIEILKKISAAHSDEGSLKVSVHDDRGSGVIPDGPTRAISK
jgi:hypothetical protein